MTLAQQYDNNIESIADRFRQSDAVDQILYDIKLLRKSINLAINQEVVEDLIEEVEEYVHYDESLEYILRQIPVEVKALLAG
tara:strand:+ start:1411 stop:1656 length:246 start_codon:yes stop_codon:yes gene_type:complete